VPFVHIPVTAGSKPAAEQRLLQVIDEQRIDLVVLARYMQVLSDPLCRTLRGRAINIHHSFLPSFAGAKPYHQAYERGVKYVGATAHYVTAELDEGPIIEQELTRVDHRRAPEDLIAVGRDAERLALARAVTWHCQHRILLNGNRTIVFN
jgi:formyltetrahydrofolate deformylase